jgi:hypothetical protein
MPLVRPAENPATVRIWTRPGTEARALARASHARHWQQLDRRRRRRLRLSHARLTARDRAAQLGQDSGLLASLARSVLAAVIAVAALVTGLEVLTAGLRHVLHWGLLFMPVGPDSYGTFVGAAVGAEAAFLALFFTTVGVIASTAYARAPAEIRDLFICERTSLIYVGNVALTLLVGLALLTMPLVAHRLPYGLTVLVFAILTVFSVLSLVILGTRLFNFFDLSALSLPLRHRFTRAAVSATAAGRSVPAEAQQQAAHDRAAAALRIYGQLTDLIERRDVSEARAAERIARELLDCWYSSSVVQAAIPAKSKWFSLTPSHPNWLTLNHSSSAWPSPPAPGGPGWPGPSCRHAGMARGKLRPVQAVAADDGVDEHDVLGVAEPGGPRPGDDPGPPGRAHAQPRSGLRAARPGAASARTPG